MKQRIVNVRRGNGMRRYNTLRRGGYRVLWAGEGLICLVK